MVNLRVSVECDRSSMKEPEVSETERINGVHGPLRNEWPAISFLEELGKILHIFSIETLLRTREVSCLPWKKNQPMFIVSRSLITKDNIQCLVQVLKECEGEGVSEGEVSSLSQQGPRCLPCRSLQSNLHFEPKHESRNRL